MDPLSIAASIVALTQATQVIMRYGYRVLQFGPDRDKLLDRLDAFNVILIGLEQREAKFKDNPDAEWYRGLREICRSAKPIAASNNSKYVPDPNHRGPGILTRILESVEYIRKALDIPTDSLQEFHQRIVWPSKKLKLEEALNQIDEWRSQIDSVLHQDHFALNLDTNARIQGIEGKLERDSELKQKKARLKQKQDIIKWISPLDFHKKQSIVFNGKCTLTGERILESEEFIAWADGSPWSLSCLGMAGAGKTVLSSLIVDHLRRQYRLPTLCIYLNARETESQTLEALVGSLVKQLLQHQLRDEESTPSDPVIEIFEDAAGEGLPTLDGLVQALCSEIVRHPQVMIVVDALDEAYPDLKSDLLGILEELPPSRVSYLTTSRPLEGEYGSGLQVRCSNCGKGPVKLYFSCKICPGKLEGTWDVCCDCYYKKNKRCRVPEHRLFEPYKRVLMNIDPTTKEIENYVDWALNLAQKQGEQSLDDDRLDIINDRTTNLGDRCREDPDLANRIRSSVVREAGHMFMLAKLYLDSLKSKTSIEEIDDALMDPPKGYDDSYNRALQRIDDMGDENPLKPIVARRVLVLVTFARRWLTWKELQDALTVNPQKPGSRPAHPYQRKAIFDMTMGLVSIEREDGPAHLVHKTADDYFQKKREELFPHSSAEIVRILLLYLSRNEFAAPCGGDQDKEFDIRRIKHPLLTYAYLYWGEHARNAIDDPTCQAAVLQFLSSPSRVAAAIQASCFL